MDRSNQVRHAPTRTSSDIDTVTRYESCAWPPRAGADPDGYTVVEVDTQNGPGTDEASGADVADVISGTCHTFRLYVEYAAQGVQDTTGPPLTLDPGDHKTVDGTTYSGDIGFYPDPASAVLLHNGKNVIYQASCAD
jgi:hypothetical protein